MSLLSGMAAALAGLAAPAAVKSLGMTNAEAADPLLIGALHGVSGANMKEEKHTTKQPEDASQDPKVAAKSSSKRCFTVLFNASI